jgi:hypothetical protein
MLYRDMALPTYSSVRPMEIQGPSYENDYQFVSPLLGGEYAQWGVVGLVITLDDRILGSDWIGAALMTNLKAFVLAPS